MSDAGVTESDMYYRRSVLKALAAASVLTHIVSKHEFSIEEQFSTEEQIAEFVGYGQGGMGERRYGH